jgi:signal transduction histidine kinase
MPVDRFVFSARVRRLGVLYVVLTVPACAALAWSVEGRSAYIRALAAIGLVYGAPILVLAGVAAVRAAPGDRLIWRLWALGAAAGAASSYVLYIRAVDGWDGFATWSPPQAAGAILFLLVANTLILRRRSGKRAALVDAVDLVMATIAATVPLAMVWGDEVVSSPHAWFAVSAAVWLVGSMHGLFVALVIRARVRPDERSMSHVGIGLGAVAMIASIASVRHALEGFPGPSGPTVFAHTSGLGMVLLFFLFSVTYSSTGLERLPAAAQVRRQSIVVIGVLLAVPVIGGLAWRGRDEDWIVATALVAIGALLLLSGLRHLLSARETTRLYSEVERAAVERGELLAEVMSHVDADRHRVAAHLHRQAVSLYTAMATFSCTLDATLEDGAPTTATRAAERMRRDLGRRADSLRRVALAVKPLSPLDGPSQGLAATIRAYLENLWSDEPRPQVEVTVDPDLELDWTSEAILVRIVQEATNNVWRHARASALHVAIGTSKGAIVVEVEDDGIGFDEADEGRGIPTMRSMAGFLGGQLRIDSVPGTGTLVRAEIGIDTLPETPRPTLTVVR